MAETNAKSHKTYQVTHQTCFLPPHRESLWNVSVRKDSRIQRTLPERYFISRWKMQEGWSSPWERAQEGSRQGRHGDKKRLGRWRKRRGGGQTSGLSDSYGDFIWNIKLQIALKWEKNPYFYITIPVQVFDFKPHSSTAHWIHAKQLKSIKCRVINKSYLESVPL